MSTIKTSLQRLVDLKAYKEKNGKDSFYLREMPNAWADAREVLKKDEILDHRCKPNCGCVICCHG